MLPETRTAAANPLDPQMVMNSHAAFGYGIFRVPVLSDNPLMRYQNTSTANRVVFYADRYLQLRLQSHESHDITSRSFSTSPRLLPDEVLWRRLYKGLALLEQGMPKEAFDILDSACQLARSVLRNQPRLLFQAFFMVFGTERWKQFTDVWIHLLRFLANMASTVLGSSHPVALALRAVREGDVLQSSAESTLRHLLKRLERSLGSTHPEILRTKRNLSVLLRRRSDLDEAEDIMKETVTACEEKLGISHVETLRCLRRLASLYMHHDKYEDAEGLLIETLRRVGSPSNTTISTTEDIDTLIYANRDLAIVAMQQNDLMKCRYRLLGFEYICRIKLVATNAHQTRTQGEVPHALSMVAAEQYIKDLVMKYDLHCDELGSRLMSNPTTRRLACDSGSPAANLIPPGPSTSFSAFP